jgi:HAD superfamily hydrolase (TIGR01549 family)
MIRAVITDCFGIFYPDPVSLYRHDGKTPEHIVMALYDIHERAAIGAISKEAYVERAARLLQQPAEKIEEVFYGNTGRDNDALAYMGSLRAQYKVVMLSNAGAGMVESRFTPEELQQFFDRVVLSYQLGTAKPDPAIYSWVCEQLAMRPEEILVVDDDTGNCQAATSVGMQAVVYHDLTQAKADIDELLASEVDDDKHKTSD